MNDCFLVKTRTEGTQVSYCLLIANTFQVDKHNAFENRNLPYISRISTVSVYEKRISIRNAPGRMMISALNTKILTFSFLLLDAKNMKTKLFYI